MQCEALKNTCYQNVAKGQRNYQDSYIRDMHNSGNPPLLLLLNMPSAADSFFLIFNTFLNF